MIKPTVTVWKLTDISLLRRANSFTTNRESKMTLATAYRLGHSPIRTQIFWIELRNIPLFVASQLVRSHIAVQFFQLSKRTDRGGKDFRRVCYDLADSVSGISYWGGSQVEANRAQTRIAEEIRQLSEQFDRYTPTDLAFIVNAEALISMSHKRMCSKASMETRLTFYLIRDKIAECDPDLFNHLVPVCVYRNGICAEPQSCRFPSADAGRKMLHDYQKTMKFTPDENTD